MPDSNFMAGPERIAYGPELTEIASDGREIFVISDLHLAAGLNSNGNYDGTENFFADASFVRYVAHLEESLSPGKKGLLIINGDLVDFLRIRNLPETQQDFGTWQRCLAAVGIARTIEELRSCITLKEVKYGLKTDDFKSIWKLYVCASGHPKFFERLAQWVVNGHDLIITKGNHDLEWYWRPVRDSLRNVLASHVTGAAAGMLIQRNVNFVDDKLIIDGKIYIEHGHRYERFTCVSGPAVLEGSSELNLPFGSFFNRYLINRIELAYPHIDDVRPRQNTLGLLLRERFPLGLQMLFRYIPFTILIIPKRMYSYAFKYLFQFILIVVVPVVITALALFKGMPRIFGGGTSSTGIWQSALSELKNLLFLSLSYFIGRLLAMLQLSAPSSLHPNASAIFKKYPNLQLVTFGHTHDPEQINEDDGNGRSKRYCNTGTWIPVYEMDAADIRLDRTYTFLHLREDDAGNITSRGLCRWNDDALRIDALVLVDKK